MRKMFLSVLLFFGLISGCKEKKVVGKFNPPKDGLIRKEMADRYIKVAVEFEKVLRKQSEMLEDFKRRYKLSDNLEEIYKAEFRKENPNIIKEWEKIQAIWDTVEDSIYKMYNSSEEEFTWIASALINPKNKPMQEYIQRKINELLAQELNRQKEERK